eukprot:Filipodium_phascolosomae@DN5683_c0_g1_i1.p1
MEKNAAFERGVQAILSNWTALRLATEGNWAGSETRQHAKNLLDGTLQLFNHDSKKITYDILADFLGDSLAQDFNVELEDESEDEVAQIILQLHETILKGDYSFMEQILQEKPSATQASVQGNKPQSDVEIDYESD